MIHGRYFGDGDPIAERLTFDSLDECLSFLEQLICNTSSDESSGCFSFEIDSFSVLFQRQPKGVLLQVYMPKNEGIGVDEGWYTLIQDTHLALPVEDFIIPCFDKCEELGQTHFSVLEAEGVWFSKRLLVAHSFGVTGFAELGAFLRSHLKHLPKNWINIGLV